MNRVDLPNIDAALKELLSQIQSLSVLRFLRKRVSLWRNAPPLKYQVSPLQTFDLTCALFLSH